MYEFRLRKHPDPFEGGNALIQYIAKESGDEQLHLLWKQYGELSIADLGLQSKLLDRATQQLRKLLQERAQVILIDDLHFAQELSLRFFSVKRIDWPSN